MFNKCQKNSNVNSLQLSKDFNLSIITAWHNNVEKRICEAAKSQTNNSETTARLIKTGNQQKNIANINSLTTGVESDNMINSLFTLNIGWQGIAPASGVLRETYGQLGCVWSPEMPRNLRVGKIVEVIPLKKTWHYWNIIFWVEGYEGKTLSIGLSSSRLESIDLVPICESIVFLAMASQKTVIFLEVNVTALTLGSCFKT